MIDGYGTLGAVALQIMADYEPKVVKGKVWDAAKASTKYTLPMVLEKVCVRKESVASFADERPSYIWWHMGLDQYGEYAPICDLGKLPSAVTEANNKRKLRINWPRNEMEDDGAWKVALNTEMRSWGDPPTTPLHQMLTLGLSFHQRVLTRCVGETHRCSYEYDEWDSSWEAEIIYAERAVCFDIPLTFDNIVPDSQFRGWRVA